MFSHHSSRFGPSRAVCASCAGPQQCHQWSRFLGSSWQLLREARRGFSSLAGRRYALCSVVRLPHGAVAVLLAAWQFVLRALRTPGQQAGTGA
eukprot:7405372-Alexandrium_andersonii.AAC.1